MSLVHNDSLSNTTVVVTLSVTTVKLRNLWTVANNRTFLLVLLRHKTKTLWILVKKGRHTQGDWYHVLYSHSTS